MPVTSAQRTLVPAWIRIMSALPKTAAEVARGKAAGWKASRQLTRRRRPLNWKETSAQSIRDQLDRMASDIGRMREMRHHLAYPRDTNARSQEEQDILHTIRTRTREANRSNITRTKAYYDCYREYPELHWSFLAHMVSRNAGWNMSDLKGGLMSDLMEPSAREDLYRMLERCNALIFQDAYPQLLLYSHSRRLGRSLFHLLPSFGVSAFMSPFWDRFWIERDSALLAVGLIINEQNYIEGRVVQNGYYQSRVLRKKAFSMHSKFQMNQVVFPMLPHIPELEADVFHTPEEKSRIRESAGYAADSMVGLILEQFSSLNERIAFGKALYATLFGYEDVLSGVHSFASVVEHRGSRSEYWPQLFTHDKKNTLNSPLESVELMKQEWLPGGRRLYSPLLHDVWHDLYSEPIPRYDWFKNEDAIHYVSRPRRPFMIEMTHAHRYALQKTALTHDVGRAVTSTY
ncbi:hypothetical protein ABID47_005517 [Paenibacillus favisporus]|uniref:DUF2515 domain-containing protein n=1 Tax=Paenibacillus favisporus TaxID=221028 RepID=A0ABV2FAY3_9BACL